MGRPRKRKHDDHLLDLPNQNQMASANNFPSESWLQDHNTHPNLSSFSDSEAFSLSDPSLNTLFESNQLSLGTDSTISPCPEKQTETPRELGDPQIQKPSSTQDAPACSCLPGMYLAVSNLSSSHIDSFPSFLAPIRAGIRTASGMLVCDTCNKDMDSFRQNVLLMNTLLTAIASRCGKVFKEIDAEATRAQSLGLKKPFRMGDASPDLQHLHTGTSECPLGMDVELDASQWHSVVYSAVKSLIYDKGDERQTLESMLSRYEERQNAWHTLSMVHHPESSCVPESDGSYTCVRLTQQIREMVAELPK